MPQKPHAAMLHPPKSQAMPEPVVTPSPKKDNAKTRTIILDYPIDFAGEHYPTLSVRRLKAKDFRQLDYIDQGGNAAAIAMAALICGVDEAIIDELDASDYLKVQEAISDFFPKALVDKLSSTGSV